MRAASLFTVALVSAASLAAQQSIFIPDNSTSTGACNVIPFGDLPNSATWGNQVYQMLIPANLINVPVLRICDLGFVPCGSGNRTFDRLQVRMDHISASTLSPTFASNMSASAVTVLDVTGHVWHNTANAWNRIGLQQDFVYIQSLGNLVIEITVWNAGFTGTQGFLRSSTIERAYAVGWTGTPPASGSAGSLAASKVELVSDTAATDTYGLGCAGSGGVPNISFTGDSKLGSALGLQLNNGAATTAAFLAVGTANPNPPFPQLLPATKDCRLYHGVTLALGTATNPSGMAVVRFSIPQDPSLTCLRLYGQYFLLDTPANALGVTSSDYARILVGL